MAKLAGPSPNAAAMLSGAVKARPGRKAMGPVVKAPVGIKAAPARRGLLPSGPPMGGLGGPPGMPPLG